MGTMVLVDLSEPEVPVGNADDSRSIKVSHFERYTQNGRSRVKSGTNLKTQPPSEHTCEHQFESGLINLLQHMYRMILPDWADVNQANPREFMHKKIYIPCLVLNEATIIVLSSQTFRKPYYFSIFSSFFMQVADISVAADRPQAHCRFEGAHISRTLNQCHLGFEHFRSRKLHGVLISTFVAALAFFYEWRSPVSSESRHITILVGYKYVKSLSLNRNPLQPGQDKNSKKL
ncbi:hypothetical protein AG1IA_06241 [Rhizoctonia solani AG-1 IA]|uniref:Uncharacterized protein n=1 Tax=Thanatephorus cucumeris (strain AG1-IA) TaxID=983506 RepID=L8WTQ2_THACA|nr:hypothetical protein AG1IA_06241 [Rhizoctonia solani AG-1 IA]